jgi:3-oxoacyl-[acyl-carrier protein] reductase
MPAALITGVGTSRSLGAGIAQKLAQAGWDLALTHWSPYDRRLHREAYDTQSLRTSLQSSGVRISCSEFDLESSSAAEDVFLWVGDEIGRADALILSHCESGS